MDKVYDNRKLMAQRRTLVLVVFLLASCRSSMPDRHESGFLTRTHEGGGIELPYVLYVPPELPPNPPLILFLHGAGERGSDGLRQTAVGLGSEIRWNAQRFPALVLFPQAPAESRWHDVDDQVIEIVERTAARYGVDPDRVYLTGISLGGYGTWHFAMKYPDRFAAIVPICGGILKPESAVNVRQSPLTAGEADPYATTARRVAHIPVWMFHGTDDDIIPVGESRRMRDELTKLGASPRYSEYQGVNHGSWDRAYGEEELWRWLFAQKRRR